MSRSAPTVLSAQLGHYIHWLGQWHRAVLHPDMVNPDKILPPVGPEHWLGFDSASDIGKLPAVNRLAEMHTTLITTAQIALSRAARGDLIDYAQLNVVWAAFESFTSQLRRVEHTLAALESGALDMQTGARVPTKLLHTLDLELERFHHHGHAFSIAICNIDHLEQVNQQHGHAVGDFVITEIVGRIVHNLRPYDDVYRLGGEEFLVLMRRVDSPSTMTTIDRIRRKVAVLPVSLPTGTDIPVSASFGVAVSELGLSGQAMVDQAHAALRTAKQRGTNQLNGFGLGLLAAS